MNLLDRVFLQLAPSRAARRIAARHNALLQEERVRRYEGAAKGRRFESFLAGSNSPNREIAQDIKALRERSRSLAKNNWSQKRSLQTIANNVVGSGIIPNPKSDATGKDKRLKEAWNEWAESIACDFDGNFTLYGLQRLVMKTVAMSGECFVLRRIVKSAANPFGLQLQVLEPEFLDTAKNEEGTGAHILNGIQYDAQGRRVGYWIYTANPADNPTVQSQLVPLSELIYVYDPDRPGQHRGVPFVAPVILRMKDLDDYDDAELYGKKISACYAGFRTNSNPERLDGAADEQGDEIERIEPGMVYKLAPGESMQFATPPVSSSYPDFVRTHRQAIAAGIGVTYEQLTGDYSNVNFSSGRMGWIEFSRNVEAWQWHMLIPMFCARVYGWFLTQAAIARGYTPGTGMRVDWTPPRREMIDPVKEIAGMSATMQAGLQSWSETVRQMGYLPEQVFEEIKADVERWKEAELSATFNPALVPQKPVPVAKQAA